MGIIRVELCGMCGSPAVLFLAGGNKGRYCDNCGAGWHVVTKPVDPNESKRWKEIKKKVEQARDRSREWLAKRQVEIASRRNEDA